MAQVLILAPVRHCWAATRRRRRCACHYRRPLFASRQSNAYSAVRVPSPHRQRIPPAQDQGGSHAASVPCEEAVAKPGEGAAGSGGGGGVGGGGVVGVVVGGGGGEEEDRPCPAAASASSPHRATRRRPRHSGSFPPPARPIMLTPPPRASLPDSLSAQPDSQYGSGPGPGRQSAEPGLGPGWAGPGPKAGRRAGGGSSGFAGSGAAAVQMAFHECRTGWVMARAAVAGGAAGGGGGGGVGVPMLSWP